MAHQTYSTQVDKYQPIQEDQITKRLNIPICAILLAKPSMQVLYERVLRRPYPRSQRHVYIGMSRPLQYLKSACLSLPFLLHSSFLLVENIMSSLCSTFQRQYNCCCHVIFSPLSLSFRLYNSALAKESCNTVVL